MKPGKKHQAIHPKHRKQASIGYLQRSFELQIAQQT